MTGDSRADRGEAVEEPVLGAEHDRRAEDGGARERRPHRLLAGRLAGAVAARAGRVGADGRHVHQPLTPAAAARRATRPAPSAWTRWKSPLRALPPGCPTRLTTSAGTFHRAMDGGLVLHRGEQRHDLSYGAGGLEEQRGFGIAHRHADHEALVRQPLHHVAADEAGAAEHRRHTARCHRSVLLSLPRAGFCHRGAPAAMGNLAKASRRRDGAGRPRPVWGAISATPVVHWMQQVEIAI